MCDRPTAASGLPIIVRNKLPSFSKGHYSIPDMKHPYDKYLLQLRKLPFVREARILKRANPLLDTTLKLRTPTGTHLFLVELKRTHLTHALADLLVTRRGKDQANRIIFAPHVGRGIAQHLAGNRANFIDLAGNCYIEIGTKLLAMVEGRTPPPQPARGRGLGVAGHQVLFAILAKRDVLNQPIRQFAKCAGVGKTAAANVILKLEEEGLIGIGKGKHRLRILNRDQILERWLVGYVNIVRPRLTLGHFRTADPDPDKLEARVEQRLTGKVEWAWGGGPAAFRLDHYYRGTETILHTTRELKALPELLRALPDRNGFLTVLLLPGPIAFEGILPHTVHPLLVYTELVTSNDKRAIDAAKRIEKRFLLNG